MKLGVGLLILISLLGIAYGATDPLGDNPEDILTGSGGVSPRPAIEVFLEDQSGHPLLNLNLEIELKNETSARSLLRYIKNNRFNLFHIYGKYELTIMADSVQDNRQYYYMGTIDTTVGDEHLAVLLPVSSISGHVIDSSGHLVENALVKFECLRSYGDTRPVYTDASGAFLKKYLPVGQCTIYAVTNGKVGESTVDLKENELTKIDLELDMKAMPVDRSMIMAIVLGIIIIFSVIILSWYLRSPTKSEKMISEIKKKEQTILGNNRLGDLKQTLNTHENKIVDYLINAGEAYQNKLVYATGIPKTSISRVLESLEKKKIIQCEKYGKVKKVKLTSWALGKAK